MQQSVKMDYVGEIIFDPLHVTSSTLDSIIPSRFPSPGANMGRFSSLPYASVECPLAGSGRMIIEAVGFNLMQPRLIAVKVVFRYGRHPVKVCGVARRVVIQLVT